MNLRRGAAPDLTGVVLGFREWALGWVLDPDQPPHPHAPRDPAQAMYEAVRYLQQYYPPGSPPGYAPPPSVAGTPALPILVNVGSWGPPSPEPRYHLVNGERVPALNSTGAADGCHWHPGVNHARCRRHYAAKDRHAAPGAECACGLYGLHDAAKFVYGGLTRGNAIGAITAWGRLQVHADGFRAEYARIAVLSYDPAQGLAWEHRIRLTAEAFDVPVVPLDDLPSASERFGRPIPDGMRGETEVTKHEGGIERLISA